MRSNLGADDGSVTGSVTLQGLGGIGKTSIALHYAYTEAPRYDVVLWMYSQTSIALAQSFTEAALKLELSGASGNQHLQNRELMKDWFSNTSEDHVKSLQGEHADSICRGQVVGDLRQRRG
jgi:predicted ATPase